MITAVLVVASLIIGACFGNMRGRLRERERCQRLCEQSFQGKTLSATARRIYCSVMRGHDNLISVDEFFGPEE